MLSSDVFLFCNTISILFGNIFGYLLIRHQQSQLLLTVTWQQTVQEIAHAIQQLIEQELAEQAAHGGDQIDRRNDRRQRAPVRIVEHAQRRRRNHIKLLIVVVVVADSSVPRDG